MNSKVVLLQINRMVKFSPTHGTGQFLFGSTFVFKKMLSQSSSKLVTSSAFIRTDVNVDAGTISKIFET